LLICPAAFLYLLVCLCLLGITPLPALLCHLLLLSSAITFVVVGWTRWLDGVAFGANLPRVPAPLCALFLRSLPGRRFYIPYRLLLPPYLLLPLYCHMPACTPYTTQRAPAALAQQRNIALCSLNAGSRAGALGRWNAFMALSSAQLQLSRLSQRLSNIFLPRSSTRLLPAAPRRSALTPVALVGQHSAYCSRAL